MISELDNNLVQFDPTSIQVKQGSVQFLNAERILASAERLNEELRNVVVTDDTIKSNKKLVAEVRKQADFLDSHRKRVKKELLVPYLDFEETVKEIVETVKEGESIVRSQVRAFEEQERENKKVALQDVIKKRLRHYPKIEKYEVDTNNFIKPQMLNKSTSLDKAEKELVETLKDVEKDLGVLEVMDYGSEMIVEYLNNFSISGAIEIVNSRHKAIDKAEEVVRETVKEIEQKPKTYKLEILNADDFINVIEFLNGNNINYNKL
ncbi:DUF1351 domain-containing protein [Eremococcus coleocola]|uniref:DUF1351 domain-containing protein n=1 Tax=Eremococcus coleocola TaxID=88132 RepID=UPI00041AA0C3|nr:DUF1351 domain-containing protein [Eremococcus coleocola]